jgi:uncharacterized protein (TIGR00299 family) protein
MTLLAWLDCRAGASGDMLLGALVGAGVPLDRLQAAVDAVVPGQVRLRADDVTRAGLAATQVRVQVPADDPGPRTLTAALDLLAAAELEPALRDLAAAAFRRLAEGEAATHGVPVDDVHLHEAGGLDTVADVVGAGAGLLALGVDRVYASPVTLGQGEIVGEHGRFPMPGPAAVAILSAVGAPVRSGEVDAECCTPTGAALLATLVDEWGGLPAVRLTAVGCGAGGRDLPGLPNVLRLFVGARQDTGRAATPGDAVVVEANVDDLDPRVWPRVLEQLLAAGASDAWLTPMLMKKGRPAHTVSVLTPAAALLAVRDVLYTHTTSIGLREWTVRKHALDRQTVTVQVGGHQIRVKVAHENGRLRNVMPEYEDVAAAAAETGRPVKELLALATAAAYESGL